MFQDTSTIEYKHRLFIERIVDFNTVWSLESEEGLATSHSNGFENADVIPFWSDKAYATAVIKEDWDHYKATSMSLADFIENWLVGFYNDGLLVGTNWNANLFGKEIEPLELALEIANEIIKKGKTINLVKYNDIVDYQTQVKKALG